MARSLRLSGAMLMLAAACTAAAGSDPRPAYLPPAYSDDETFKATSRFARPRTNSVTLTATSSSAERRLTVMFCCLLLNPPAP